ncbi:hypothetical protein D6C91_07198 [Aureobasidium pullulans]|uniref:Uncharacterized protein n=1 Tax=Aureobasidium pullulans TaxID=5580 RepID=A0A4S9SU63_AURPU|nr:hypothetical protein D6C91_07198 [Aureobasidium pullulans]
MGHHLEFTRRMEHKNCRRIFTGGINSASSAYRVATANPNRPGPSTVDFGSAQRRNYHIECLTVPTVELVSHDRVTESLGATHKVYDKQGASGFDEDVEASPEVQAAIEGNWTDLFKGRTTPRPNDVGPDKRSVSKQRPEASPVFQC